MITSSPTFQPGNFDVNNLLLRRHSSVQGNEKYITDLQLEPNSRANPLNLDPLSDLGHSLIILSPSDGGGCHSPSGSSFWDIAYNDHGGDDYLVEP
jgi:hypothetical protein